MNKKDVKKNILPHSKAKLDLYKSYLSEYLPILGNSKYIDVINIFDIFCGTGMYDDGNLGSPLIAAKCILDYEMYFERRKALSKPVRLFLNDYDSNKINTVNELIESLPLKNCTVSPFNLDATEMFDVVANNINSFGDNERSLVFIDPYGYSKIDKNKLYNILQRRKSEVILFLPVAHMKRFTGEVLTDYDKKAYENLRKFIFDFFDSDSRVVSSDNLHIFDYIEELRIAFSYNNEFYTASHYIERDKANYYALFFIGHHIYGLEKFIEAKWRNASLGKGFNQKDNAKTLFDDMMAEYDKNISVSNLEKLTNKIFSEKGKLTNKELYEYVLTNQFKPSHMNQLLRDWHKHGKIFVYDQTGRIIEKPNGFGLTYKDYKERFPCFTFNKK